MIITALLTLQNQLRIFHWQTESYAEHKALGKAYESLDDLIDSLVEQSFGKYGREKSADGFDIKLQNYEQSKPQELLHSAEIAIRAMRARFEKDGATNLSNITDEILGVIDQTSYLLTLS
jgi:hypothetical protein